MRPREDIAWMERAAALFGVGLRYHTTGQAAGPCPRCGGTDRFTVFVEGNSYCRQCRLKRWWDRPDDVRERIAEEALVKREAQARARQAIAECRDWMDYHQQAIDEPRLLGLWEERGVTRVEVEKWGLGVCSSCPLAPGRASLAIPVFRGQRLLDIRHRLIDGTQGDKYRSHVSGLVPAPFNLDAVPSTGHLLIVEGEIKAIHLIRAGYPAVGLPGTNLFDELVAEVASYPGVERDITLMLDPGADEPAEALAQALLPLGHPVYLADAFGKPDDLLLDGGPDVISTILKQARRYGPGRARTARLVWS